MRWLHDPKPISKKPDGLGFPHLAGRYRPGGPAFSSLSYWRYRDMERFLIRGWYFVLPGVRRELEVVPRGKSRRALAP